MMPNAAIFLDRDGVIIENQARYVRSWSDVSLFPQALEALKQLAPLPYKIIMVTNQSAIGRGLVSVEAAEAINARLLDLIRASGGRIDEAYICPHAPEDRCDCRKPEPGMILAAAKKHTLDLKRSTLIGDAVSDLQAGAAAGIRQLALVQTGRGRAQEFLLKSSGIENARVWADLRAAVRGMFSQDLLK